MTVATTAIGGDHQPSCMRVSRLTHFTPPAPNALHGKLGGVMIDAHIDPAGVGGQIIDAIRGDLAQFGIDEVMNADFLRRPFGLPFLARILEVANQFLFLVSTETTGSPAAW